MKQTLFKVIDICQSNNIERRFIRELHQNGLIEIVIEEDTEFVIEEEIALIERYSTWHYQLDLNIEGIEVVQRLIGQIEQLQSELRALKGK